MTEPRTYRAGLGLPPAIRITSHAAPPRSAHNLVDLVDHPLALASADDSTHPGINTLPREIVWKEWNINPTLHGPERIKHPPNFVASKLKYDELGRSIGDGVEVEVDMGGKKGGEDGEEKECGERVREWYLSLGAGSGGPSASGSGTQTPFDSGMERPPIEPQPKDARPSRGGDKSQQHTTTITTTQSLPDESDDDAWDIQAGPSRLRDQILEVKDEDEVKPNLDNVGRNTTNTTINNDKQSNPSTSTTLSSAAMPKPLRVHRRDWFIRRALLSSSNSSSSSSSSATPMAARPTSIGSMLNITPSISRPPPPVQYVLGPDNKGYELLRDKLGWRGGGLGRPEGWDGDSPAPTIPNTRMNSEDGSTRRRIGKDGGEEVIMEIDPNGHPVVDLTLSSDESESESELELDSTSQMTTSGPGRTAPIATALKLDRLGLGHQLSKSNPDPKSKTNQPDTRKKITHTDKEIKQAQRRAKYGLPNHTGVVELGKKGKIKWKEKDRKERDERRRLAAALNA
ncbi:hypothetical protein CI109_104110 [Kwoniella shandongensis]|uniref:Uncharacterized protein n=1 Tax=Kwoniella shandongensis TaxID=1734106 RepID=A0A5M6C103_9TREE|nr:uncharacterized protein CI109_002979 [Kwoniella shandongensis]KAA5528818.1 hypothetical protein CI109_002979 [Kwoniella shandongensis]